MYMYVCRVACECIHVGIMWRYTLFQKAQLLGFPTHAAFILDMRMAKKPEDVASFLTSLASKLQPLRDDEFKLFLQYKKEEVS